MRVVCVVAVILAFAKNVCVSDLCQVRSVLQECQVRVSYKSVK